MRDTLRKALTRSKSWQAGVAFGVPIEAVSLHTENVLDSLESAVEELLREAWNDGYAAYADELIGDGDNDNTNPYE